MTLLHAALLVGALWCVIGTVMALALARAAGKEPPRHDEGER